MKIRLYFMISDEQRIEGGITGRPNEPRPPRQNRETNFEIRQSHVVN